MPLKIQEETRIQVSTQVCFKTTKFYSHHHHPSFWSSHITKSPYKTNLSCSFRGAVTTTWGFHSFFLHFYFHWILCFAIFYGCSYRTSYFTTSCTLVSGVCSLHHITGVNWSLATCCQTSIHSTPTLPRALLSLDITC